VEDFPGHVAAVWLGHSEAVANEHYRQVTDEHYARAAEQPTGELKKAVRNPVQLGAESARIGSQATSPTNEQSPVFPGFAAPCGDVRDNEVPPLGLEQTRI
jgi:hypothetical protein